MKLLTPTPIITSQWPVVSLSEACTLITDGTHQTPTYSTEGFIFLSAKNVVGGRIDWENVKRIPDSLHRELHKRLAPEKGDILLAKNGTTGVAAVVDRDAVFDIYVSLALLRPRSNVLPEYLVRVINSPNTKRQFNGHLKGIGVPNLHLKDIRNATIPLPPLAEQKRIAGILDAADALRAKRRAALAQLDALAQSLFLDLFGDPVTNPKGWEVVTIGEALRSGLLIDVQDGNHGERHPKVKDFVSEGIPFIMSNCMGEGRLHVDRAYKLSAAWQKKLRVGFSRGGDVLLSHKGTIGEVAVVPTNVEILILSPQVTYYRPSNGILSRFLAGLFSTAAFRKVLEKEAVQSTRAYIGITRQKGLRLVIPPLPLQQQFAAAVEAIERQKARHREQLAGLDALFASLQHRAFRGEL